MTRLRKCPITCACLCHDTSGGVHVHPGRPCPTKEGKPLPEEDWTWS